jgi:hypothetical protein
MATSSRYEDLEFLGDNRIQVLSQLETNLHAEILLVSESPLKLDRLADRYNADGLLAKTSGNMGAYIKYVLAYERCILIQNCFYAQLEPIDFDNLIITPEK